MRHTSPLGAVAQILLVPGASALRGPPRYVQPGTFAHEDRMRRATERAARDGITVGEAMALEAS